VHEDIRGTFVMALVESLLTAIARADGDALVMHVGEKPYVVTSAGPIELSAQALNLQAMAGMVAQLLPEDAQRGLAEFGAVEHELPASPQMIGDRLSVVVARGGDDVWIEVRRHRGVAVAEVSSPASEPIAPPAMDEASLPAPPPEPAAVPELPGQLPADQPNEAVVTAPQSAETPVAMAAEPTEVQAEVVPVSEPAVEAPEPHVVAAASAVAEPLTSVPAPVESTAVVEVTEAVAHADFAASSDGTYGFARDDYRSGFGEIAAPAARDEHHDATAAPLREERASYGDVPSTPAREDYRSTHEVAASTRDDRSSHSDYPPVATIIPMTRTLRIEVPPPPSLRHVTPRTTTIERLLNLASSRRAKALYLTTGAPPHVRTDAEVSVLDGEAPLTASEVESAVLELAPESSRQTVTSGDAAQWTTEVAGIGDVRCSTFHDHRGPGAIFQIISKRPVGAEQLGLPPEIRALATEAEGLVLVVSSPGHGRTTLVGALVDEINKHRSNYVITLEREICLIHDRHSALISQRQVRDTADQKLAAARAALREKPDVLVIDEITSADMLRLALEAAGAGVLVVAGVSAPSATVALTQLVELVPQDDRQTIVTLLAERLRGAVAQVLLRKPGGGRTAAREVVLTTAAVAAALADNRLRDLPSAIESGRKYGLVTLTEALTHLAKTGVVDLREVYRKAADRDALLAALKRENVDTGLIEQLSN
jgi:twitching motility protein PilT